MVPFLSYLYVGRNRTQVIRLVQHTLDLLRHLADPLKSFNLTLDKFNF